MKLIYTIFCIVICSQSFSQTSEKEAIKKVVYQLFEGFEKNDTNIVAPILHKKIIFRAVDARKKPTTISESNYAKMMEGIAKPKTDNWREIPSNFEIKIDNEMANVWVKYKFYNGDIYSHKGIDNFILYKEKDQWQIIYLIYTRR
jgi:Putative lumazine-binding